MMRYPLYISLKHDFVIHCDFRIEFFSLLLSFRVENTRLERQLKVVFAIDIKLKLVQIYIIHQSYLQLLLLNIAVNDS